MTTKSRCSAPASVLSGHLCRQCREGDRAFLSRLTRERCKVAGGTEPPFVVAKSRGRAQDARKKQMFMQNRMLGTPGLEVSALSLRCKDMSKFYSPTNEQTLLQTVADLPKALDDN